MTEHVLKTQAGAWDAILSGEKTFEVRRNDRFYQRGDILILRKLKVDGHYVEMDGLKFLDIKKRIGWFLQGGQFGIEPGFCVFSLEDIVE